MLIFKVHKLKAKMHDAPFHQFLLIGLFHQILLQDSCAYTDRKSPSVLQWIVIQKLCQNSVDNCSRQVRYYDVLVC